LELSVRNDSSEGMIKDLEREIEEREKKMKVL
jgi:hypothetical protein